jgi:hypothetical protein
MKAASPALINFLNEVIGFYDGQLVMADAFLFALHTVERQAVVDAATAQAHREAERRAPLIAAAPDEIEFDHVPSEAELDKAFPNRKRLALDDRALA